MYLPNVDHEFDIEDTICLLDIGHSTTKISSSKILAFKPYRSQILSETHAYCAGSKADERFEGLMRGRLAGKEGFSDKALQLAIGTFQSTAKRSFATDSVPEKPFLVPVQGIADNDEICVKDGQIGLATSDLHDIFEPIVVEILQLVKDHIKAIADPIQGVCVCGRFSQSPYIRERLSKEIGDKMGIPYLPMTQPTHVVAMGAALCAQQRLSRGQA
ncbi:uncharacterized protein PG998_014501 [Apiospora kogelbergensis]|uniref:uncharacterized protein n=1 Tax=Apiospora kogelbergensis TaxID=1337665 RepID=UPI00312E9362